MSMIDKDEIIKLGEYRSKNCISIYINTHQKGLEVIEKHDLTKLKNHIQNIRAELQQKGLRSNEVEGLLKPIDDLQKDWVFWRYQSEGLAIYRTSDFFQFYKCPIAVEDQYYLGDQFILRPVFPLAQTFKSFYLLVFGKKGAILYKGNMIILEEVDTTAHFPSGIEDITKFYDFEAELQGRTSGVGGPGARHRSDDMDNKHKDHLLADYFRLIDEGIKNIIGTENSPLLLASVEYYQPIYQQINSYPFLNKQGLTGNFDHVQITELHDEALKTMQNYFSDNQSKKLQSLENNQAGDKVSTDIKDILSASFSGRVDTTFISKGISEVWGRFSEETLKTTLSSEESEDGEPLVERAVLTTLKNGGEVYVMEDESMPGQIEKSTMAALMRY